MSEKNAKVVRTPTVLQLEAAECGAATLAIILGHYGRIVPLATLRQECGVSRDGSKASNVLKAAKHFGMTAKGYSLDLEGLKKLTPPYIVFWNFDHFLVVEGFGKREVHLNDPAIGHRKVTLSEFSKSYTGIVLVIRPGPDFEKGGRRPSMISAVASHLRGARPALWYCVLAGFLLVLPTLALAGFSRVFLDQVLLERRAELVRPIILAIVVVAALHLALRLLQRLHLRRLRLLLSIRLSSRFIWKLLQLPTLFYAQRYSGEVATRSRINDKVADLLSGQLVQSIIDGAMMVFLAIAMFVYDPVLAIVALTAAIVSGTVLRWISKRRVEANMRVLHEYGKSYGVSLAGLQSVETIKSTGLESHFFQKWAGHYTRAAGARQELELSNQTLVVLPALVSAVATALVLTFGALRIVDGSLSIGELVAFQTLMLAFLTPVYTLVQMGGVVQELHGDLQRLDDVLDNPIQVRESDPDREFRTIEDRRVARLTGHIEVNNLTFGYSPLEPPLLHGLNLVVRPGEHVAIVGPSGSGKSTLVKLISGELTPWKGEVRFDRVPRDELPPALIASSFSVVEQEIFLFGGTVRENLTLWDGTLPEAHLVRACEDACVHKDVLEVPGAYDGLLLEGGSNLSGGQAQRLELARALVNGPAIVVLDEATSALDAETERMVLDRLRERECTIIIVSHRLSAIRDCDQLIVMADGKIEERGTHDELWSRNGIYRQLISIEGGLDVEQGS